MPTRSGIPTFPCLSRVPYGARTVLLDYLDIHAIIDQRPRPCPAATNPSSAPPRCFQRRPAVQSRPTAPTGLLARLPSGPLKVPITKVLK